MSRLIVWTPIFCYANVMKKILILIGVIVVIMIGCFIYLRISVTAQSPCDETLWKYNAEQEIPIKCITFTSTVVSLHGESDGDENIQVQPDLRYVPLLNWRNWFGQGGQIAVEPICEKTPSKKAFEKACAGYKSNLTLPKVGDHIAVTGSYGTDQGHGWREIHPVTKITAITK